jgi:hypothetical protein
LNAKLLANTKDGKHDFEKRLLIGRDDESLCCGARVVLEISARRITSIVYVRGSCHVIERLT